MLSDLIYNRVSAMLTNHAREEKNKILLNWAKSPIGLFDSAAHPLASGRGLR